MRSFVLTVLAVMALVLAAMPDAAADEHCRFSDESYFCEEGGGGGTPDPDPPTNPWTTYTKGWDAWAPTSGVCADGFSARAIRFLYWTQGPLDGTLVDQTQFGGITGRAVPNAPSSWDGSPAQFAADGLVYDIICTTPDTDAWWLLVEGIIEDPTVELNPHTLGVTGLDTWFWYDGATSDGPITDTYTDAAIGLTYAIEIRASADQFTWDTGDGTTYTSADPGDDTNLPNSAAAIHVYETKAIYYVAITVRWTAEVRLDLGGGGWTAWAPIPGSYEPTVTLEYPVSEIVTRNS